MAITFTTGTINQPDAGSVGLAMADKIRDDVVAHAAWDLVEEFTPASGTMRWYVLKCNAVSSLLPRDFYVVVGRILATGELRFHICESYTMAGHMMQYFAGAFANPNAFDAFGREGTTYSIPATTPNLGANFVPKAFTWVPGGTSTKWWITVDNDGFTVAFNGSSNGFVHVGAFTPMTQLVWDMPLLIMGTSDAYAWLVSNPAMANIANTNYQLCRCAEAGGSTGFNQSGPRLGFEGLWQYNDKLQNNQRPVAEQGIVMTAQPGQADYTQVYGFAVGKQKRMRCSNQPMPAGVAFGDAFALSGRLWVPYLPSLGKIWDTGVAST